MSMYVMASTKNCFGSISSEPFACARTKLVFSPSASVARDPCASSPCQNGGTCTRRSSSSYSCTCMSGYRGTMCQCKCEKTEMPFYLAQVHDLILIPNPRCFLNSEQKSSNLRNFRDEGRSFSESRANHPVNISKETSVEFHAGVQGSAPAPHSNHCKPGSAFNCKIFAL